MQELLIAYKMGNCPLDKTVEFFIKVNEIYKNQCVLDDPAKTQPLTMKKNNTRRDYYIFVPLVSTNEGSLKLASTLKDAQGNPFFGYDALKYRTCKSVYDQGMDIVDRYAIKPVLLEQAFLCEFDGFLYEDAGRLEELLLEFFLTQLPSLKIRQGS